MHSIHQLQFPKPKLLILCRLLLNAKRVFLYLYPDKLEKKNMGTIKKLDTIQEYNLTYGVETLHPLISIVDFSTLESLPHGRKNFGFYAVFLKQLNCGELSYGRSTYDYQEGTLVFVAPGQVAGVDDDGVTLNPKGWALLFHPDLIRGTSLGRKMKDYSFFSYEANEALHTSERERQIIINCFEEIHEELQRGVDKHSKDIIASTIELMLNHCQRFYDRQFITRETLNKNILVRFENLLNDYFESDQPQLVGLPSVQYAADKLHLSANYFGDLIKKETGKSAQESIQLFVIEKVKERLYDNNKTISEVAYELGFKYPHHLSRMFKKIVGVSPNEYRV